MKKDNKKANQESGLNIEISEQRKISDVQKEFNEMFPYLKLEFFTKTHGKREGSEKKYQIDCSKKICDSRKINKKGLITIHPKLTVAELEKAFMENFGLSVQVFRKSGKMWLQSTITDDWTLREQNEHGEALTNFKIE